MKKRRLLSALTACAMLCTTAAVLPEFPESVSITASAEETVEYTEGTYEMLTYQNYGDHIVITGCDASATEVVVPSEIDGVKVTSIGLGDFYPAFYDCSNLTTIYIPDSVTTISNLNDIWESAFGGCTSLTAIEVDENNANYSSENGVLFNQDKTSLLLYPCGKTETSYTVPDGMKTIEVSAFSGNTALTEVSIPIGITSIGSYAFSGCTALTTVYYGGSQSGWNELISNSWRVFSSEVEIICARADADYTGLTYGDLIYSIADDDTITITGCTDTATDLVVPETIDGLVVDAVASYAFADKTNLVSVTLPAYLEVMGEGIFSGCTNLVSIAMPESVDSFSCYYQFDNCKSLESLAIPEGVTTLTYGFENCTSLKSLSLPKLLMTLTSFSYGMGRLHSSVFYDCTALEEVTVHPENTYVTVQDGALFNLESLESSGTMCLITYFDNEATSYTVPDGVQLIVHGAFLKQENLESITLNEDTKLEIGGNAFDGCSSLQSLHIPSSVYEIGSYCFQNTPSLTEITVDEANEEYHSVDGVLYCSGDEDEVTGEPYNRLICYPANKEGTSFTVPTDVTGIASTAFHSNQNLEEVIIGENITYIPEYCFSTSVSLQTVSLPSTITSIGTSAFWGCPITAIDLPDSLTYIGNAAFANCKSLESIAIPAGVTSIGDWAFEATPSLTAIDVDAENTVYKSVDGVLFNADMTTLIVYPAAKDGDIYTVPETVTTISPSAFHSGNKVKEVILPENLLTINSYTFSKCTSLERITIPSTVTTIGTSAFHTCTSLTSIVIPESVTSIGDTAFKNCTGLVKIEMPAGDITISDSAFEGCTVLTMYGTYDTAAHIYAQAHDIPFVDPSTLVVSLGNINGDATIDATDASALLIAAANVGSGADSGLTAEQEAAADLNGDGMFDASDASLILMYAAYTGSGGTLTIEEYLAQQ